MDNRGFVNAEGGPLLVISGASVTVWSGVEGDDYERASSLFDSDPDLEGGEIAVGDGRGVLWEMRGAGSADVFADGDLRVVVVRVWPVDPVSETAARELANEPLERGTEVARIEIKDGVLVVLWAAESGAAVNPRDDVARGRPSGELALDDAGLVVAVRPGTYRCVHDVVETTVGVARRLHLIALQEPHS